MGSETKTQNGFTCQQWSHTKVRQLVMQFAQFANCNIICFLIKEKNIYLTCCSVRSGYILTFSRGENIITFQ